MTIVTKFDKGDTFFVIKENGIKRLVVETITWDSLLGTQYISTEECDFQERTYFESQCFLTKEDLLKSL